MITEREKKQKALKQKIMEDLLADLFDKLDANQNLFELQELMDFIFSVLVMFNREVLVHVFVNTGTTEYRKEILRDFFDLTKEEINKKIKRKIQ